MFGRLVLYQLDGGRTNEGNEFFGLNVESRIEVVIINQYGFFKTNAKINDFIRFAAVARFVHFLQKI